MEIGGVSNVLPARFVPGQRTQVEPERTAVTLPERSVVPPQVVNPVGRYDQVARLFVLEFRDHSNGEVKSQIPPERIVEEYRRLGFRRAAGVAGADGGGQPLLTGRPLTTRLPVSSATVGVGSGGSGSGIVPAQAEVSAQGTSSADTVPENSVTNATPSDSGTGAPGTRLSISV